MSNFTSTINDAKVNEALTEALEGRKPFRRFKDTLGDYPQVEKQWYLFEEAARRQVILDWLGEEGIELP